MRAVVLEGIGEKNVLRLRDDVPAPEPQGDEVRVRIRAFGINRADVMQRTGNYRPIPGNALDARIPGIEYAGEVEALGPRARERKIGERVFGITVAGGYAELLCVHERMAMRIPEALSFEEAASLPETYMTAFDALEQGGFAPGGSALIHTIGSGVGLAALQMVHAAGGISIGTSRTPEKLEKARAYGLTGSALLDEPWEKLAQELTNGAGVDTVLEFIGPSIYERNLTAVRECGKIVQIAELAGEIGTVNLRLLKFKRVAFIGVGLRRRHLEEKILLAQKFERLLCPQFQSRKLRPVIDAVYPFDQVPDAQQYMEENRNFGKIVVRTA